MYICHRFKISAPALITHVLTLSLCNFSKFHLSFAVFCYVYFSDFDHNDDLKISKEEYLKYFDKRNDAEGYKIEMKRFGEMDKNNDGYLSADEVSNVALEFSLTAFVNKHAEMLFMTVDADKDGKLSSVEIITNYPLFTNFVSDNSTDSYLHHDEL